MQRILPMELKARLDRGEDVLILDVRNEDEFAAVNLGGKLLPLHELPSRVEELPRDRDIVVLCHHGIRSAHATAFLAQAGFTRIANLVGGIDRWATEVDSRLRRY